MLQLVEQYTARRGRDRGSCLPTAISAIEVIAPAIASFSRLAPLDAATAGTGGTFPDEPSRTYVRLRPGADVQKLARR